MTRSALTPPIPPPPVGLCLGGFDPSAGAGVLRDAVTLWETGVLPMAIPLAETLQNGLACLRILPPAHPPLEILESLAPHLVPGAWGAKLGLCAIPLTAVPPLARALAARKPAALLWDPILGPSRGDTLHSGEALLHLAEALLPHGHWVVTPNRVEAAAIAAAAGESCSDDASLARPFLQRGAQAVWLKGGHGSDNAAVEDVWITPTMNRSLGRHPRLPGERRGTGCTLGATWLGLVLQGHEGESAAAEAAGRLRTRWPAAASPGGAGRPCFLPVPPC